MKSIGIDIGYSAVKVAVFEAGEIIHVDYALHRGDVSGTLKKVLERLYDFSGLKETAYGAVTGSGAGFLTASEAVQQVNEVAALVEGSLLLDSKSVSIIEMGGQTAKFITGFSCDNKANVEVSMTSNCSSGTGSFLEEQVSRLGMDIEEYSTQAAKSTFIPRIAGRCSVFAKTDITHHQQEGVSIADILAGLAHAVVKNYRSAVMRGLPKNTPMLFVGGVCRNNAIVDAMRSVLKLDPAQLRTNEFSCVAGAIGAAVLAAQEKSTIDLEVASAHLAKAPVQHIHLIEDLRLEPLTGFGAGDGENKHVLPSRSESDPIDCWLGIDVGSTSTNVVLVDEHDNVLGYRYLRTAGDPARAVRTGLSEMREEFGDSVRVAGAATTGSGRVMIGRMIGADVVRDEITAQARAAVVMDPEVDTIFEIGGQDSKFIALKDGVVADFQMNKICAAGTGSFIEEQAKKLGIALEKIGPTALSSETPLSLGERCTVFMESSIAAHLAQGANIADLSAGLCYSIVKNYMNRVVGQKHIGHKIFLQGGVAYNQGVVNAFRAVTGRDVSVPPFFSVTGALGAAILAREEMTIARKTATDFKGFAPQPPEATEQAESGENPGAEKGVDTVTGSAFNRKVHDFIFDGYDGKLDPAKKTVGIPRTLFTFGMFPLFHPFFKKLELNVLLSAPTNEETIRMAQEYSLDETCYPVKLINGHTAELVEKGVDYLFFPDLFTAHHPGSKSRRDYGCAYMQLAFKIINKAMDLNNKGIQLLAPTIAFSKGPEFMQGQFMHMGRELGKSEQETGEALQAAMSSFKAFQGKIQQRGEETIANLDPDKKTFVLISKIYGVADPVLNLGIADTLAAMGYQTLPFYDLPEVDIFNEHPNMYWPFAQHTLEAAKLVAKHPNLYAVFLTHHGCGPDTVTAHYFKEIMGKKPYLTIEVDEHSSGVGVLTRVEAFVNSLGKRPVRQAEALETYTRIIPAPEVDIRTMPVFFEEETLLLPRLYPYSRLACTALKANGYNARELDATSGASIDMGRNHTVTNEYYSLAVLMGDLLHTLQGGNDSDGKVNLLFPQNEGAEVDGQYSRFLRTKLNQSGFERIGVISPYLEDLLKLDRKNARKLFLCLLAGDLVLLSPREKRETLLRDIEIMLANNALSKESLASLAGDVRAWNQARKGGKTVFASGEPMTLYNDALNDETLKKLEQQGHRVIYAPLSESMWAFWRDLSPTANGEADTVSALLSEFQNIMATVAEQLGEFSHLEPDLEQLVTRSDDVLGLYAGAFGRYRSVKPSGNVGTANGVITVTSMYENTGISLDILRNGKDGQKALPMLALTFDGNRNKADETKVDSFMYYI